MLVESRGPTSGIAATASANWALAARAGSPAVRRNEQRAPSRRPTATFLPRCASLHVTSILELERRDGTPTRPRRGAEATAGQRFANTRRSDTQPRHIVLLVRAQRRKPGSRGGHVAVERYVRKREG